MVRASADQAKSSHCRSQLRYSSADLTLREASVSKHQRRSWGSFETVISHWVNADGTCHRKPNDFLIVKAGRQLGYEMKSCGGASRAPVRQVTSKRGDQSVSTKTVNRPHPTKVAVQFALAQELGECQLLQNGGPEVRVPLAILDGRVHLRR